MAQAVCEFGSGRKTQLSAASLSGMSFTLATGISHLQHFSVLGEGQEAGEEGEGEEEGGSGGGKEGGEGAVEGGVAEEEGGEKRVHLVATTGDGAAAKISTVSPTTSNSEDAVQTLLENVPRVGEEFEVLSKIGEGTFSSVYLGRLKGSCCSEVQFALKHLVPTSAACRIENELRCLQSMGGRDNVIPLLTCLRHRDHIVLVMPYFPHTKLSDFLYLMTPAEVQRYMRGLFTALRNVHSHHIIHRDVKPSNFLYNRQSGRFQLVDFGLAHLETSRSAVASTSSSSSARSKSQLRSGRANTRLSLTTPPTSSSTQTTTTNTGVNTQRTTQSQALMNGTPLLPPPPPATYRRHVHRKLHPQSSTAAAVASVEEGGRRVGGRKRGKEREDDGGEGRSRCEEERVCPLRHKKTELCDVCQNRAQQNAPRAGTPGFRAPEVLLKCPHQTTAVDIWSAGVILLCLLSGRYPFFRASDDLSALAQIIALMGSVECTRVSRELGKELVCGQHIDPVDLRELCWNLRRKLHDQQQQQQQQPSLTHNTTSLDTAQPPSKRNRPTPGGCPPMSSPSCRYQLRSPQQRKSPRQLTQRNSPKSNPPPQISESPAATSISPSSCSSPTEGGGSEVAKSWHSLPESAFDLLERCLELNPMRRLSAAEALQHPFLADVVR